MIRIIFIAAVSIFIVGCTTGLQSGEGRVYSPGHIELQLEMHDGVILSTDVFIPRTRKRVPAILVRTPYNKHSERWLAKTLNFFKIAVVIQDVRGKYESGGEFYPFINERDDGLETLEWIRDQPWSDGTVGGFGASYLGITQWAISDSLDFLVPMLTGASIYDFVYPEGVFSLKSAFAWGVVNASPKENSIPADKVSDGMFILPLSEADDSIIKDIGFLTDWMTHESENEYWEQLNWRGIAQAPLLSIAGWYDIFLLGQIRDFQALEAVEFPDNRMIIGPWCHGNPATGNQYGGEKRTGKPRKLLAYTVRAMKGKKYRLGRPFKDARYNLFIMERNEYVGSETWPPEETVTVPYYIGPEFYLGPSAYSEDGLLSYVYDPSDPYPGLGGTALGDIVGPAWQNDNLGRTDQVVFETSILDKPLVLLGEISATLWLSSDRPCTGFVISLQDVLPDGRIVNIQEGAANVQFLGQEPERHEISVWSTGYQLNTGHRIRVVISSSWFPRFNRNLNNCEPVIAADKVFPATQKIYYGEDTPSSINLPVYFGYAK